MFDKIQKINDGLDKQFPNGKNPFQIMTRLLEECGELASEVNHFENSGKKNRKHGEPSKIKLAHEIQDVLRSVLQICSYYQVEDELKISIDTSYQKLKEEGLIK